MGPSLILLRQVQVGADKAMEIWLNFPFWRDGSIDEKNVCVKNRLVKGSKKRRGMEGNCANPHMIDM